MAKGKVIRQRTIITETSFELLKELDTATLNLGHHTVIANKSGQPTYLIIDARHLTDAVTADQADGVLKALVEKVGNKR